ncbi:hypothetical protein LOTGIDRAFT_150127 [Lottia gigantea]|uniref:Lipocalin/cytosolic fatty-acid binding domain-containing protein n=1 Tax=Lottia gigantea TaxID=225164 RepID=V4AF82_LOTGI|nr:hypothetical protein LOTGIDRAFT_150127 [Lottia gigantea]ESO95517.1 hypothetical protein LOTGIDRAFT_150127 [Lottia gigantea]
MAALIGKWKKETTDNLGPLMDKMGISDQAKQMISNSNPTVEISQNGDTWNFITTIGDKNRDIKFKLGEEFENNALNGETVKSVITLEGDSMVEKFDWRGKTVTITRKVVDGKLVSTMSTDGVTAVFTLVRNC